MARHPLPPRFKKYRVRADHPPVLMSTQPRAHPPHPIASQSCSPDVHLTRMIKMCLTPNLPRSSRRQPRHTPPTTRRPASAPDLRACGSLSPFHNLSVCIPKDPFLSLPRSETQMAPCNRRRLFASSTRSDAQQRAPGFIISITSTRSTPHHLPERLAARPNMDDTNNAMRIRQHHHPLRQHCDARGVSLALIALPAASLLRGTHPAHAARRARAPAASTPHAPPNYIQAPDTTHERRRTTTKRCCVPTRAQSGRRRSMGHVKTW